jgi:glucosamine-6-phosphate deaminase
VVGRTGAVVSKSIVQRSHVEAVQITISATTLEMARRAAETGAGALRQALRSRSEAGVVLATGTSQLGMLGALLQADDIDWSRVTAFHLDEYVGIADVHPASFRKYLKERFVDRLPVAIRSFHFIDAEDDPDAEIRRLNTEISGHSIDVSFVGIGENGHLAFNDPPADFETDDPYLRVQLDERCRRQQMGEGWFGRIEDVPTEAVSMSVRQILKSKVIICTVPDSRKAEAVRNTLEGPVTPDVPASILQRHGDCHVFLDRASAALLTRHGK